MRRLQVFSFKKSSYERPNQKWICGRACLGEPCLAGPDKSGRCQATAECRPLKKGDRWYCTRPAALGGPCGTGPLPEGQCTRPVSKCQPVRSGRAWRGLIVLLTVGVVFAALLLVLTTKLGQAIVSPGELSFQHSSRASRCADCHWAARSKTPPLGWLSTAGPAPDILANSRLCLKCHDLGPESFTAHTLPPDRLAPVTRRVLQNTNSSKPWLLQLSSAVMGNPKDQTPGLACASCHLEHRGKTGKLTVISDLQCQSCHAAAFTSFSASHPDFREYPFRRRTRLIFDHRSHLRGHFQQEPYARLAPNSCSACHAPDAPGRAMVLKPFANTCAACHLDQIKGKGRAGSAGIALLRVPGLDVETLARRGLVIGDWPEGADGKLTPFMELLLRGRSDTNSARLLSAGVDLLDLSKAGDATLQQAANFAWSVKMLFYDLSIKGHSGLEQRLSAALNAELSASQAEGVAALLSADVIRAARDKWFPHLATEIDRHQSGQPLSPATNAVPTADQPSDAGVKPEDWVARGGWYRSDLEFAIFYRPAGHSDAFLRSWLDLTVTAPVARGLFTALSDTKALGLCAKCHSIDTRPAPRLNWLPYQPGPFEHTFTRFSHVAHFSLLDDRGCQTCHPLDSAAPSQSYAAAFGPDQGDATVFHSNFKSISLTVCAACHTKQYAGEGCLQCHNYHIGHFVPTLPRQQWPP